MTTAAFPSIDGPPPTIGDIKFSFVATDHVGWVRLDGRAVTALSAVQQTAAAGLGIGANLPNAATRNLRQRTRYSTGGSASTRILTQANLPNFNYSVVSNTSANTHTHALSRSTNFRYDNPPPRVRASRTGGGSPLRSIDLSTNGAHTHAYSFTTGGSATAFSVRSAWISVYTFLYLGL